MQSALYSPTRFVHSSLGCLLLKSFVAYFMFIEFNNTELFIRTIPCASGTLMQRMREIVVQDPTR